MGQDEGRPPDPRGWYLLGVILSVVAMLSMVLALFDPQVGYPLGFLFTMLGLIAYSQPAWLSNPNGRARVLVMNSGLFAAQAVLIYASLYLAST